MSKAALARIRHRLRDSAALAAELFADLMHQLAGFAGQGPGLTDVRRLMRDYLVPAEAALRRSICLLAALVHFPLAPPRPRPQGPARNTRERRAPECATLRPPVFRLTETLPRPPADQSRPAVRQSADSARRPPDTARIAARFRRRLDAFTAASADPLAAAKRFLRLRARRGPGRPLLSTAYVPGRRSKRLRGMLAVCFDLANEAAAAAFPPATDTS